MMTRLYRAAKQSTHWSKELPGYVLLTALGVWFLWPALFSVHVEAFSARLLSEAIMSSRGNVGLDDQAYPMVTQYLYSSRQFTVLTLSALMKLTHSTGDINFRLLILSSYFSFVYGIYVFVRRWSTESKAAIFFVLVLTPGLVEIAFFFADNLPSAAMAVSALALITRRMSQRRWLASGALFAAAMLFRLDALFVLPSICVVALLQEGLCLTRFVKGFLLFSMAAAAVLLIGWRLTGVSLYQAIQIGRYFAKAQDGYSTVYVDLANSAKLFFGLPALLLIALGGWENWRARPKLWNFCLTLYPAPLYLFYSSKAIEVRDFLLLGAPFLVLHGATGARKLLVLMRGKPKQRALAYAGCAICVTSLVLPAHVLMKDGPRAKVGRLWSTLLWRNWQKGVERNLAHCDDLVRSAHDGDRVLVITSMFNAEAYFHLRLLQNDYSLQTVADGVTPFDEADLVAQKGSSSFLEVRTESPYAILSGRPYSQPSRYTQAFQLSHALSATASFHYNRAYLATWGGPEDQEFISKSEQFNRPAGPMTIDPKSHDGVSHRSTAADGALRMIPLSSEDVESLRFLADREVRSEEESAHGKWKPMRNFVQMHDQLILPYWIP
jgi:hypothetical protein